MADTIKIGDKELAVAVTAFTPIIYSGEFRLRKENGKHRDKDINDGLSEILDGIDTSGVPPLLTMLQFLWAFAKTADKNVPGFKKFVESLPPETFDMSADESWAQPVWELAQANFLKSAADVAPSTGEDAVAGAAAGA